MSIQIEMLQLCERAENVAGGDVNIYGLTDTFRSASYPYAMTLAIVCRFRLPARTHVTGKLGFILSDPDEKTIWFQNGTIDLFYKPTQEEHTSVASTMTLKLNNFRFENAGTYEVKALWDGMVVATVPLFMLYPTRPGESPGHAEVVHG